MHLRRIFFRLVVLALTPLVGCSLDYSQVSVTDEMSKEIPDSVLHNFSYTKVEGGSPAYQIEAEKAEFYSEQDRTYISQLEFREYDNDGKLITDGKAGSAVFFTDTENAELEGALSFYSATEEATVATDYLYWDNEKKLLLGNPESRVIITEDDGSGLNGIGFEADVRRRLVDFAGPVSGRYVTEGDE